jgi:hypothetical protein
MGLLINGQVGWRSATVINPSQASTLWTSVYAVYNADAAGSTSLNTSLFAAYNGESNANDSFGSNNGTAQGGLTYTAGKIGNAFTFNGTNAYASLPDNSLNLTGDFTISFWIYHTSSGSQTLFANTFLQTTPSIYKGFSIGIDNLGATTNKLTTLIPRSSTDYLGWQYNTSLTLNAWNHIIITRESGVDTYAWINNVLQTVTFAGPINSNNRILDPTYHTTQRVAIGASNATGTAGGFMKANSKIDALTIWNRQLTADERTQIYNSGNGAQYITDSFYKPTTNDALNTYNGTAQGGLTYGVGKVGTAFQFNGSNAYVQLGDVMDIGTSSWSYSAWFNASATAGSYSLLSKTYAGIGAGRLRCTIVNGKVVFAFAITVPTNIIIETTNTISANTWYNVVFVLDRSNNLRIYLNGVLQSVTVTAEPNNMIPYTGAYNNTNPFRIGSATAADGVSILNPFNGSIDAFNVWNRVLTQTEITELYNSGNGKQYPN